MTTAHTPAVELESRGSQRHRFDLLSDALVVDTKSLVDSPAQTLCSVENAREQQRVVAVDSVGIRPDSLSLLPLIEPDIIVLAPELANDAPTTAAAHALHVLAAQAERTGAVIVASGIDTEMHRRRALAMGATFGIGELYSPAEADSTKKHRDPVAAGLPPTWSTPPAEAASPFDITSAEHLATSSTKRLLIEMSTHIECQAALSGPDTLTLGTFQHARQFGPTTRRRWRAMAARIAYTGVYGVDMRGMTDPGITHSDLDPTDPLIEEWNIVVLGQFYCCVLSARDLRIGRCESDRRFDYVVSHDRGTVIRCARAILSRFDG